MSSAGHYGCPPEHGGRDEFSSVEQSRGNSLASASHGAVEEELRDIIDDTTSEICKYVNTVAGDTVLANPDNTVRTALVNMLLTVNEQQKKKENTADGSTD